MNFVLVSIPTEVAAQEIRLVFLAGMKYIYQLLPGSNFTKKKPVAS